MPPTAQNLCLHYLHEAGRPRLRLALDETQLRHMVQRERNAGRRVVPLDGYTRAHPPDASHFTLSFDDAHRSLRTVGVPLLRALEATATVFVPTGFVGTSDDFLSWDDLRALRDAGWTLGAHSVSHPRMSWRLYDETPERYAARLYEESSRSREVLARELGVPIELFAYPYGEAPPVAREAVARAGFLAAFTVAETCEWTGDRLAIPRRDGLEAHGLVAPASDTPTGISVIVPACDRVEILAEVVRRWTAQSYPAEHHEVIVVDDGSREDLRPLFEHAGDTVRLIPHAGEADTFRAGQARQRGADSARFDTLAFVDADVAVSRDFLWHLDWIHRRVPGAVVLGYLSGYNLHDLGHLHTLADVAPLEDLDGHATIIPDRSREPALKACLDNLDWLAEPWRLAYTGNLSLPKSLLARVGGFAKDFEGWGLEDLDLGYRLHAAGGPWVFSRFAVGYHLTDPSEPTPRNPFRRAHPKRDDFAGYRRNLETLRSRHADDPAIEGFHRQAIADIDETCSAPDTVGIELGGTCSMRCAFHRRVNSCQPGGLDGYAALDRLAYALKVGARAIYILGGEPGEHPGVLPLIEQARAGGITRITMETNGAPFALPGWAATLARAGLGQAVLKVYAFDASVHEAMSRVAGSYARFERGYAALGAAGVRRTARVLVDEENAAWFPATLRRLAADGVPLEEVVLLDPQWQAVVSEALDGAGFQAKRPSVRIAEP